MTVIETVEQALVTSKVLSPGEVVLVGVSGGVDSMVLLDVLGRLAPDHRWRVVVAHFNHQLRGVASDEDEAFVKSVAQARGLEIACETEDVVRLSRERGVSVEMAAREARHSFLARCARERGIGKVLLAHHADDQAELFFLRLFRGTGSDGLGGMKAVSASPYSDAVCLIRPLLACSKSILHSFATEEGVRYREDASNKSRDVMRNRVRHELLPLLRSQYSEAILDSIGRTMDVLGAEHAWIETEARRWLADPRAFGKPFDSLSLALQREVLRLQLLALEVVPEFRLVEALRRGAVMERVMVAGGRRISRQPDGRLVEVFPESTEFCENALNVDLVEAGGSVRFGGLRFEWAMMSWESAMEPSSRRAGEEWFDADRVGAKIILRHWRRGDRFQPIGMAGSVKLQDWFTNEKVSVAERRERVVAEGEEGQLFWVEDMRISERFRLASGTRRVLKIAWKRDEKI